MSQDPFQALYSGIGGALHLTTIESIYPTVCFGYFTSLGSTVCPFRRIWKLWPGIFPAAEWDVANILKSPLHIACKQRSKCQSRPLKFVQHNLEAIRRSLAQLAKYPQGRSSHMTKYSECALLPVHVVGVSVAFSPHSSSSSGPFRLCIHSFRQAP